MHALQRTATTEMEVTSIRLERELKDKLKEFSGDQGYQALVREILWNYVRERSGDTGGRLLPVDVRSTMSATSHSAQYCALTGSPIRPGEPILLGLTGRGNLVPLKTDSLDG